MIAPKKIMVESYIAEKTPRIQKILRNLDEKLNSDNIDYRKCLYLISEIKLILAPAEIELMKHVKPKISKKDEPLLEKIKEIEEKCL